MKITRKVLQNKYDIELDYNYMLDEKILRYYGVNYLKDQFSDYDYRLNTGPGLLGINY